MIGYIQAEILGKVRGLKFGTLAAENITMELVSLGAVTGGNYSTSMMTVIIYWGLYNCEWSKKQELDLTFEQISDWVDMNARKDEVVKVFAEIAKCYEESTTTQETIAELKDKVEEIKKKMLSILQAAQDGQKSEGSPSESSDGPSESTTIAP